MLTIKVDIPKIKAKPPPRLLNPPFHYIKPSTIKGELIITTLQKR